MGHAPDVYALSIAGLVVIAFTVVQAARASSGLPLRFPRLSGRHLSTLMGWVLLAAATLIVVARQK